MKNEAEKALQQQLSALVDSELSELELRRLLKQINALPIAERNEAYQSWGNYQLIQETLHDERGEYRANNNFISGVSAAIDLEAGHTSLEADSSLSVHAASHHSPIWVRFAVAASVALAAIVGVQQYQLNGQFTGDAVASNTVIREVPVMAVNSATVPSTLPAAQLASLKQTDTQNISTNNISSDNLSTSPVKAAEAQRHLNEYLLEHANYAAQQAGRSTVPYARLANFDEE